MYMIRWHFKIYIMLDHIVKYLNIGIHHHQVAKEKGLEN